MAEIAQGKREDSSLSAEETAEAKDKFAKFEAEAHARWDFEALTNAVLQTQRQRRLVWSSLQQGKFTPWDYSPPDDGINKCVFDFSLICLLYDHF